MAGQDGKGEEFAEGEGTRERFAAETAQHPQRPLRQVSASFMATHGLMMMIVTSVSVSVSWPFPFCVSPCVQTGAGEERPAEEVEGPRRDG